MHVDKLRGLVRWVHGFRVPLYAANASFFLVLSAFPALLLLLGLLRRAGLTEAALTALLRAFLPQALMPAAEKLIQSAGSRLSGPAMGLSAVTALWSASRGVYGLLQGMNGIYSVEKSRGYFRARLLSAGCTLAFLMVLLLTLGLQVLIPGVLPGTIRYLLLLTVQTGVFCALYRVLPHRPGRFRDGLPGAAAACGGWLAVTGLFSVYVRFAGGYTRTYGSVYTLALGMLWLYVCISIVFYGGVLNVFLEKRRGNMTFS